MLIVLRNGFTTIFKGSLNLSYSKMGELMKTGEFFMIYSEVPNMSEYNAEYASKLSTNRKGSPDDDTTSSGQGGNSIVRRSHSTTSIHRPVKRPPPLQGHFRRDNTLNRTAKNS
ncbi:unnamed protein product [Thelazia callipaeda]|uniref:Doublecortin domain-containing protein n=1 Tax=Thelazia callipaeda TaxID=103827 RepID=A0A0N5DCE7_THECL|nr:unnamed protein product [Thelazia callipaeda]